MGNIAFVPVRNGSKGIPGKNTRILGGKPLLCHVLDTLVGTPGFDDIWIATDSDKAEKIVNHRYGIKVKVFRRSDASSTDTAPVIDVIKEFIGFQRPDDKDHIILVQATSPFTTTRDFTRLLHAIGECEADSYISCARMKKFCWSEEGYPLNYTLDNKPMRQNYSGLLIETGAFYATSIGKLKETGLLLAGKIKIIETALTTAIDIDDENDWRAAEHYISDGHDS